MIYFIGNSEIEEKNNVYTCSTINDCIKYFKDKKVIQFDTETEYNKRNPKALPNAYEHKVLCYQLGDKENQFVIDNSLYPLNLFKYLFEDESIIKLMTNGFFDIRFLFYFNINIKNVWDCFLVERALTRGIKHEKGYLGLQSLVKRYCNVELSKEVRGEIHWRGLDSSVIKYAATDVIYMENIMNQQKIKAKNDNLENYITLEHLFLPCLAKVSYKGFKIDPTKWLSIAEENRKHLLIYKQKLDQYVISSNFNEFLDNQLDLFDTTVNCKIKWSSSKQVIKLFEKIGINVEVRDKAKGGTKKSVEGKHLIKQSNKFEILPIYLKYKEIEKEISTYGESFIKQHFNPVSQRVHSEFFQILNTGRISSSNPNLQNITASDDMGEVNPLRTCFIAEKGNTLIVADYSQQEPRVTADKCQDPALLDFIFNGDGDSHSLTSTAISEYLIGEEVKVSKKNNPLIPKYNKKIRDIGKMINLGLDYGKTAFSVKDDLETTQQEAQKLIDILKAKFPQKENYFKTQIDFALKHGYVITDNITNSRSYFEDYHILQELADIPFNNRTKEQISKYAKTKGALERFAQNFPIQGLSGLMTKYAVILFDRKIEKLNLPAFIVNLVHDEIVAECEDSRAKEISEILVDCMVKAGEKFCKTVPMKVDPIITKTWQK
jgi:DNA polymerase-1